MKKIVILLLIINFSKIFAQSLNSEVNTMVSTGLSNVNVFIAGAKQEVAMFVIDNDYPNAFEVSFEFINSGKLIRAGGANEVNLTDIIIDSGGGVLGEGLTPANNISIHNSIINTGVYVWDPGEQQTTPTQGYILKMFFSWNGNPNAIAGLYIERINAVITPRL